jgi:cytochrome b involved in lipid metabolism
VFFEVERIKYKGQDVTKIYESLDLIDEINEICKEKAIYGKL